MKTDLLKAIVIDQVNGKDVGRGPYRNIKNSPGAIKRFKNAMKQKFPYAKHINFYCSNRNYLMREYYECEEKDYKKPKVLRNKYLNATFSVTGNPSFLDKILLMQWDL